MSGEGRAGAGFMPVVFRMAGEIAGRLVADLVIPQTLCEPAHPVGLQRFHPVPELPVAGVFVGLVVVVKFP